MSDRSEIKDFQEPDISVKIFPNFEIRSFGCFVTRLSAPGVQETRGGFRAAAEHAQRRRGVSNELHAWS